MNSLLEQIQTASKSGAAWKPAPGEALAGEILAIRTFTNSFGTTPMLDIKTEADGQVISVFCKTVIANEIKRQNAQVGDLIGIRYDGKVKNYQAYTVIVRKAQVEEL